MNFEDLIFKTASSCIPATVIYFSIVTILDYIRTMIFSK